MSSQPSEGAVREAEVDAIVEKIEGGGIMYDLHEPPTLMCSAYDVIERALANRDAKIEAQRAAIAELVAGLMRLERYEGMAREAQGPNPFTRHRESLEAAFGEARTLIEKYRKT